MGRVVGVGGDLDGELAARSERCAIADHRRVVGDPLERGVGEDDVVGVRLFPSADVGELEGDVCRCMVAGGSDHGRRRVHADGVGGAEPPRAAGTSTVRRHSRGRRRSGTRRAPGGGPDRGTAPPVLRRTGCTGPDPTRRTRSCRTEQRSYAQDVVLPGVGGVEAEIRPDRRLPTGERLLNVLPSSSYQSGMSRWRCSIRERWTVRSEHRVVITTTFPDSLRAASLHVAISGARATPSSTTGRPPRSCSRARAVTMAQPTVRCPEGSMVSSARCSSG